MGSINDKLEYLLDTKEQIKQALIDKNIDIDENTTFRNFAVKTAEDTGLVDTSDANATTGDILKNKTTYVNGQKLIGTLENQTNGGGDPIYENLFKTLYATQYTENTVINLTLPEVEVLSRSFSLPNTCFVPSLSNYGQTTNVNLRYEIKKLPDTLKYMYANLGTGSDIDTSNITELPSNLEVLDSPIFYASPITNINLPNCLKILNRSTFAWSNITTINLSNVEFIGNGTFSWCNNLSGPLSTPNVYYIGGSAFKGCSNITGILNFPNLKYLCTRATDYCDNITDMRIGNRGLATGFSYQLNTQFYGCNNVHGIFINEPGITPNFDYFSNTNIPSNYIIYSNHPLYVNEYDTNKYLDILFYTNKSTPNIINVSDLNIQLLNNATPLTPILFDNHYARYIIDQDNLNLNLSIMSTNYNSYTKMITTQVSNRIAQREYIFLDSSVPSSNYKLTIYMQDPSYLDIIEVYNSKTGELIEPDTTDPWVYTVEDGQTYEIQVQSAGYEPYSTQCSIDGQDIDVEVWMNPEMNP